MAETKGPKINYTKRSFTTRDNLGINAAGTSYQAELCPVVNTVTPRAFYWMFAVWNFYDYWQNYHTAKRTWKDFEENFQKRNDYFFILANLLTENSDRDNLVGKDNCMALLKKYGDGPYEYERYYFVSHYGGMQYYVPGCSTLGFITNVDGDGNELPFPKITEKVGVPLAKAFEAVIRDTEYYRSYRLRDVPIPREVLLELGSRLSLAMDDMDECKALFRKALFEPQNTVLFSNEKLIRSKDYLLFLNRKYGFRRLPASGMRRSLYDYFCPSGEHEADLPENLREIATEWEVAIGRQYFALSIELIWKYMLLELTLPMNLDRWVSACLRDAKWSVDIQAPLKSISDDTVFGFDKREQLLSVGSRGSKDVSKNLETALLVLLSVCNRFKGRSDVRPEHLMIGGRISVAELSRLVEEGLEKPVSDLLAFVMVNWVVKRHEEVAFRKMTEGRDGFFIEKIDDLYYHKVDHYPDFTGNRMLQLMNVLDDLDMLE